MYIIKQTPEDFIVNEISNVKLGKMGQFTYFKLQKKNYTTVNAIQKIAERIKIPVKRFGFAGNKDKIALTSQLVSVRDVPKEVLERVQLKDIEIEVKGFGNKPISLGDLYGNEFRITIRNLIKEELDILDERLKHDITIKNYFGEQRFSNNNVEIGKAIVKKDFKKAVELILENEGDYEKDVKIYLEEKPNDFIGALRKINKKILKIFVSAYQSYIFNKVLDEIDIGDNISIPIIGFGTELDKYDKKIKQKIEKIIKKEEIGFRDFIIREIPELSSEGTERKLYMDVSELQLKEVGEDTINLKFKAVLEFKLGPGSYATEVIKELFKNNN